MRIIDVKSYGIDQIIAGYVQSEREENPMNYRTKSMQFFSNCEIILEIADVRGIEFIMLKQFCPTMTVIDVDKTVREAPDIDGNALKLPLSGIPDDRYKENMSVITDLNAAISNISRMIPEDSRKVNSLKDISSMRFHVLCRFEKSSVMALIDVFPETKLRKKNREYMNPEQDEFATLCIKEFVTNFYSMVENKLTAIDILTDVRFKEEYFNLVANRAIICTLIRTPYGFIDFRKAGRNVNSFLAKAEEINKCKEGKEMAPDISGFDISIHFAVNSSMATMLLMMCFGNYIYYYEDLKTIVGTPSDNIYINRSLRSYHEYCANIVDEIDKVRLKFLKDLTEQEKGKKETSFKRIALYDYIPRCRNIKYMIQGTWEELNHLVNQINQFNDTDYPELALIGGGINKILILTKKTLMSPSDSK